MTIKLLSTQSLKHCPHCLIYGPAKSGKTRLALTAKNPVICSTDEGLSSIREANLPFHRCTKYEDYLAFEKAMVAGQFNSFDECFLDDLTELAELFLVKEKPRHKNLRQAYGALNDEMMRVIRLWREQTNFVSVILCKQEKIKDESTGGLIYGPLIPGKAVAPMLPYLLGSVYNMGEYIDPTTQQSYAVLRCKRNAQYEAGDRSGKLAELELANLSDIFAKSLS